MADTQPTVGELFKAKLVAEEGVKGAVEAILAAETGNAYPIGEGLALDLDAALKGHAPAQAALSDPNERPAFKRTMARTAVILARPTKR